MICKVHKYIFIGMQEEIDSFLRKAQQQGFIEFIATKKQLLASEVIKEITEAIKILYKQSPVKEQNVLIGKERMRVVRESLQTYTRVQQLEDEEKVLDNEYSRIDPLGDFSLEEIYEMERQSGKRVQFFVVKEIIGNTIEIPEELIYITTQYDLCYFFSISDHILSIPEMVEMKLEYSLADIKKKKELVLMEKALLEKELKKLPCFLSSLKELFFEELNKHNLEVVKNQSVSHLEDRLFSLEGWIPKKQEKRLIDLLKDGKIHAERVPTEPLDRIPTYMENHGVAKLGEDLVYVYDVPSPEDRDPSIFVFWFFALFFSMIVADAGYGILFLGASLLFRRKKRSLSILGKRILKLFTMLSVGCIIWGVIIGSYFGLSLSSNNPLKHYSILQYLVVKKADYHIKMRDDVYEKWVIMYPQLSKVSDPRLFAEIEEEKEGKKVYPILQEFEDNILLEISLLVGIFHICFSLLRYIKRNWAAIGWCSAIVGAYFYFPDFLHATSLVHVLGILTKSFAKQLGCQMVIVGGSFALILALIQKRWKGIGEIANSVQIFADILSYLRIYALGMAAMIMAGTFNWLGQKAGIVGGFFLITIGHLVNIILGIMSGVIHGLRLNFIEWYHYSFHGDGKRFNPLRLQKK